MNPLDVHRGNVWNYSQNKLILVVEDFYQHFQVPKSATAKILLARGVGKWLGVRRQLIKLKQRWKTEIHELQQHVATKTVQRGSNRYWYERGRREALEECRASVRRLCHSERWQWPDYDHRFEQLLDN